MIHFLPYLLLYFFIVANVFLISKVSFFNKKYETNFTVIYKNICKDKVY